MAVVTMPPDKRETARVGTRPLPEKSTTTADTQSLATASRQVSWWSVHEYVAPQLAAVESWPMVGTPAWCALDADDPAKMAALLDAAQHHALRVETCQQAKCEASRAISAAEDWPAIAQAIKAHNEFYAERPWLKRVLA